MAISKKMVIVVVLAILFFASSVHCSDRNPAGTNWLLFSPLLFIYYGHVLLSFLWIVNISLMNPYCYIGFGIKQDFKQCYLPCTAEGDKGCKFFCATKVSVFVHGKCENGICCCSSNI